MQSFREVGQLCHRRPFRSQLSYDYMLQLSRLHGPYTSRNAHFIHSAARRLGGALRLAEKLSKLRVSSAEAYFKQLEDSGDYFNFSEEARVIRNKLMSDPSTGQITQLVFLSSTLSTTSSLVW